MWKADNTNALFSKLYNAKLKDTFTFGALTAASEPSERLEDNPVSPPPLLWLSMLEMKDGSVQPIPFLVLHTNFIMTASRTFMCQGAWCSFLSSHWAISDP